MKPDLTDAIVAGREASETFTALGDDEVAIILRAAYPYIMKAESDRAASLGREEPPGVERRFLISVSTYLGNRARTEAEE